MFLPLPPSSTSRKCRNEPMALFELHLILMPQRGLQEWYVEKGEEHGCLLDDSTWDMLFQQWEEVGEECIKVLPSS